jgi:SAM-dependent methyltransferase
LTESSEFVWRNIWKQRFRKGGIFKVPLENYLPELVFSVLSKAISSFNDKVVLECGSGSGQISFRVKENESKVILLDVSKEAIKKSKILFASQNFDADYIVGSMFNLPFKRLSLDVVFSSGVLEHFTVEKQQQSVEEGLRALKKGGKLIVIVPNEQAKFYTFFRKMSKKAKTWPYGHEEPLSADDLENFSPTPLRVYSCGFLWQFTCIFIPIFSLIARSMLSFFMTMNDEFVTIDRKYPGYLISAIWKKA